MSGEPCYGTVLAVCERGETVQWEGACETKEEEGKQHMPAHARTSSSWSPGVATAVPQRVMSTHASLSSRMVTLRLVSCAHGSQSRFHSHAGCFTLRGLAKTYNAIDGSQVKVSRNHVHAAAECARRTSRPSLALMTAAGSTRSTMPMTSVVSPANFSCSSAIFTNCGAGQCTHPQHGAFSPVAAALACTYHCAA